MNTQVDFCISVIKLSKALRDADEALKAADALKEIAQVIINQGGPMAERKGFVLLARAILAYERARTEGNP